MPCIPIMSLFRRLKRSFRTSTKDKGSNTCRGAVDREGYSGCGCSREGGLSPLHPVPVGPLGVRGGEAFPHFSRGWQEDGVREILPRYVRFDQAAPYPNRIDDNLPGSYDAPPIGIVDALDELDNDCIRVSELATQNAVALADVTSLLLELDLRPLGQTTPPFVNKNRKPSPSFCHELPA